MATGTPRHTWVDNSTAITAAKLNELEQDVADALATAGGGGGTAITSVVDIQTQAGVTGNGTTDDATAINAAITAAPAGTLFWFAPGKIYKVGATVVLKPGCTYASSGGADGAQIVGATGITGAILAAQGWQNNTLTSCDSPVQIRGLQIIGPGKAVGSAHGIVLVNFWSRIENCVVGYVGGVGIRLTDVVRNGSALTSSSADCSENKIINCKVTTTGSHGVHVQNSAAFATNQDGHLVDTYIDDSGGSNAHLDRGAGWFISRNHLYGSMVHGMYVANGFATHITDNYVEQWWGQQGTAATDYAGIFLSQGPYFSTVISGNFVAAVQGGDLTTANSWVNYLIVANSAATTVAPATVVFTGNSAESLTATTGTNNKSLSVVFTGPDNATGQLLVSTAGSQITPGGWATTAPGWYSGYSLSSRGVAQNPGAFQVLSRDDVVRTTSTTAARPSASAVGAGATIYDTTLGKPIWSNGTVWKDAAGTTV